MFVQYGQFLVESCPDPDQQNLNIWRSRPQSTHRVAIADFWRTSHRWWGWGGVDAHPSQPNTITYKVAVYAPAERADTLPLFLLYPYMYSVVQTRSWSRRQGGCSSFPHSFPSSPSSFHFISSLFSYFISIPICPLWSKLDPDKEDVPHLDEDGLVGDADGALLLEVAGRLHKSSLLARGIQCFMVNNWY